ncbi:hypothetical protein Q75_01325 [Bacillus coahuilensis p1.1.43]|uniref:Uncharacterized protein n=1 Tax=Bacillus coahuilensis p1.1.43 TaxID=1150625 RepID=A0A147KC29_9BACI|nr:cell wall-active antibiotics response protein LiaF [Bacillus coahuilensis]KUP09109.1 hypothetical protein Q75_01325 [Bacillus coahuilensis p1.1.43]
MKIKADVISWIVVTSLLLLVIQWSFFDGGPLIVLVVNVIFMYIGRKRYDHTLGKILFWIGLISFIITIIDSIAFQFFLIALLLYVLFEYRNSKKTPIIHRYEMVDHREIKDEMIRTKPLFQQTLFQGTSTPESVYEWNDINVQGLFGDHIVDLSYTVLPKGESVIFIRNTIGNVKILVPYEVEVSIQHSTIAGAVTIFSHQEQTGLNKMMHYKTAAYDDAPVKVKMITSLVVGDLEVHRI